MNVPHRDTYRLPPINLLMLFVEMGVILIVIGTYTSNLQNWSPLMRMQGPDLTININSGIVSSLIFKKTGSIPLWNPLVGNGEPTFESVFSYLLNPFEFLPVLVLGDIQGAKLGVLIHIFLMGLGGWALGRVLRLGPAGRVTLALLSAGTGSMASGIGNGFYQYQNSLAYVPWIFTGLIGVLYMQRRWAIGLLAVASAMMFFAGTFWYIIPTAITASFFIICALIPRKTDRFSFKPIRPIIRRLLAALLLTVGLAAIRLLPLAHSGLFFHPPGGAGEGRDFLDVLRAYVTPEAAPNSDVWFSYHYVIPWAFVVLVVVLRLFLSRYHSPTSTGRWRIFVPALLATLIFSIWAQEGNPVVHWLYENVAFMGQWRWPVRIAAAASPWPVLMVVIWFDDIMQFLARLTNRKWLMMQYEHLLQWRLEASRSIPLGKFIFSMTQFVAWSGLAVLIVAALLSASDVLVNWSRVCGVDDIRRYSPELQVGARFLRTEHPGEVVTIQVEGEAGSSEVFNQFVRDYTANPEVFTRGVPSTIGPEGSTDFRQEYGIGINDGYQNALRSVGYLPLDNSPVMFEKPVVWRKADVPSYAFLVARPVLETIGGPLKRTDTQPVSYIYGVNRIEALVGEHEPDSVVVVQETAYPGWTVQVNGQPAALESIGGKLGVVLPGSTSSSSAQVVFTYRPTLLYLGATITLLTILIFSAFMLRLDERIPASFWGRSRVLLNRGVQRGLYVLTSPEVLESKHEIDRFDNPPVTALTVPDLPALEAVTSSRPNGDGSGQDDHPDEISPPSEDV